VAPGVDGLSKLLLAMAIDVARAGSAVARVNATAAVITLRIGFTSVPSST